MRQNTVARLCLLILTAFHSFGVVAQPVQLPQPEIITARQGLPQAFVAATVQDRQGFIWMATRDGLCRYDGNTFRVFQPATDGHPALSSPGLTNLVMAPDGRIWISTDQRDLDCFDPVGETFVNFSHRPAYRRAFGHDTLDTFYPDHHNQLWLVFRGRGLVRFDLKTGQFQRFTHQPANPQSLGSNAVTAVIDDGQGMVWVAHSQGLDRFDPSTEQFTHFRHQPGQPETIPDHDIQQLYRRPNGELWLQSWHHLTRWQPQTGRAQAFPVANPRAERPRQITADSRDNDYIKGGDQLFIYNAESGLQPLTSPTGAQRFVDLFVDQSDVLWVGTDLLGVYKFNLRAASFTTRPYQRSFHDDLLTDYLGIPQNQLPRWPSGTTSYNFRSTFDPTGALWFTVGGTPIYRLAPKTNHLTRVPFPVPLRDSQLERPTLLATDPDGQIWVVHPDWSGYYQVQTGQWIQFPHPLQPGIRSAMVQLVVDRQALWIATNRDGLYRVDRQSGLIRQYSKQVNDSTSLSSNSLYSLMADPLDPNMLWVGTFGSGLCRFDKRTGHCQRITTRQGLPNQVIYAAIPDRQGSVWIATNKGLGQLDRRTGRVVRTYTQEDGLGADEFNRFHVLTFPDGRIVLGTIYGLTAFDPARIRADTFQPRVQLADLLVNNRPLPVGALTQQQPVSQLTHLQLPYNQNFVTIRFAAMQYNRLGHTQYRYQLNGLDPDWVTVDRPEAIYTALPPGDYQFRVQAANTAGQWSRYVRRLTLTIKPPWWATGWAYAGYALLLGLLVYGGGRTWLNRLRLRQTIRLRQQEADQLRALDETKSRFFANITHELRTPLTLILGPTERLSAVVEEPDWKRWLATIDRNAQQLLNLINQLLDMSRLEAGVVTVDEQRGAVSAVISQLAETIRPEAESKGLYLTVDDQLGDSPYWFDAEKLTRIGLNLLGNALKFTRQGGITVTLQPGVRLLIQDTGPGIAADDVGRIFDRFYQGNRVGAAAPGSGIGLALVKELVDLQGGTITVESRTDAPTGTCFTVLLPYQPATPAEPEPALPVEADTPTRLVTETGDEEPPLVLVVEDNAELADFIAQSLPTTYRIRRAGDGADGLKEALAHGPNLIISDVLMPRMDGYTLCRTLKQDPRTSHIPVILLTAKVTLTDRLTGLEGGADDYLTKPFHVGELQLRVRNLLDRQRQQRAWFRARLVSPAWADPTPADSTISPDPVQVADPIQPDPFVAKLDALMAQHLDDAHFGVEELALHLGMSRVHLYRKVKAVTGLTATELMRNYRLKQATRLLAAGHSITETSYQVGFDTPAYFTKCFRELYGLTPSDYLNRHRGN